jgi:hypothetical protein
MRVKSLSEAVRHHTPVSRLDRATAGPGWDQKRPLQDRHEYFAVGFGRDIPVAHDPEEAPSDPSPVARRCRRPALPDKMSARFHAVKR